MSSRRAEGGGSTTASMQVYEDRQPTGADDAGSAGLVLLYAPTYQQLLPAYPLSAQSMVVGREPPADIVLPLPAVSRRHARLQRDDHRWWISDLGARNGTLVGGRFVARAPLHHGDQIRIGDAFFKFVSSHAEGYAHYRIDGAVLGTPASPSSIVGGYQLASISAALQRIALSDIPVMLLGESGTGKDVVARQVHTWSGRSGAFCALNCAALPPTLLESELFGYRRGAFSGADRDHVGIIRAADGGTLFLDEVGDLPLPAQAKLLRVLQTKEVLPVGATTPEQVDVRVMCATHQDLAAMQSTGGFRGDLYARLNGYRAVLPPLRERKEDVFALCMEFLRQAKRPDIALSVPYITGLLHYDFPYNVRELETLIQRGIALSDGCALTAAHLSAEIHAAMQGYGRDRDTGGAALLTTDGRPPSPSWQPPPSTGESSPLSSTAVGLVTRSPRRPPTEQQLREVLASHRGNVAAVGRHFGKERMQVHRWMKRFGIDPDEYRR